MTLLAAFQALLHRYSGQEVIAVGSPIAGRTRSELEGLIGFFVNTLVLKGDLSGNPRFGEFFGRMREETLGTSGHQELPFERLVEAMEVPRDLSRSPLFQVMFAWQEGSLGEFRQGELEFVGLEGSEGVAKFDLTLWMEEVEGRLQGEWEYNTDLFDRGTIERMAGHFR